MRSIFKKSIIASFAACLSVLSGTAFAGFSGDFNDPNGALYTSSYGQARGYAIAVDTFSPGGPFIYVAGSSSGNASGFDFLLVKYSATGVMIASATFDYGNYANEARGVALDRNGNVIVAGYAFNGSNNDYLAIKYSSNLVFISSAGYDSGGSYSETANAVSVDGAGNIYVTGTRTWGGSNAMTVKYGPNFVFLSSHVFYATGDTYGNGITAGSNDSIYVTGQTDANNIVTLKYSNNMVYISSAAENPGTVDTGFGVAVDSSNNVYVAGRGSVSGVYRTVMYKYNPNLVFISSGSADGEENYANALALSAQNGVPDIKTAGRLYTGGTSYNYDMRKWDTSLNLIDQNYYDSGVFIDEAFGIASDANGNVYVTGYSGTSYQTTNMRTMKFSPDLYPDTIAPATITELTAVTGAAKGTVNLYWNTPGDDDMVDMLVAGSKYKIRYSTDPFGSWMYQNAQITISTSNVPQTTQAGLTVTSLTAGGTYYFKIWTADEWPNWSNLSNTATAWAQVDNLAPAAITNLTSTQGEWVGSVRLNWKAPGNDGWSGNLESGSMFGLMASTNPYEDWGNAKEVIMISTSGVSPDSDQTSLFGGLDPGVTYYFVIGTMDEAGNKGLLSPNTTAWATMPALGTDYLTTYGGPEKGWMAQATSPGGAMDRAEGVAVDPMGNVYTAGYYNNGSNEDIFVRKYNDAGVVLWTRYYNDAGNGSDRAMSVAADSSGNVFVTGSIDRYDIGQNANTWIRKYDTNGNVQWTDTYNSPADSLDRWNSVKVGVSGSVYVAGYENRIDISQDDNVHVRKYDTNGNVVWTTTYTSAGNFSDIGYGVAVSEPDVFVTGAVSILGQGYNVLLLRLNANDGLIQWTTNYNASEGSSNDYGTSLIANSSKSEVLVTGNNMLSGQGTNIWIGIFDYSGVLTDSGSINGASGGDDMGRGIAEGPDGVYLAGTESIGGGNWSIWATKLGQYGLMDWTTTYISQYNGENIGNGITLYGSSVVYVAGYANGNTEGDNIWLRKYVQVYPNGAPNGIWVSSVTESSIKWQWNDNATNEEGYRVKLASGSYKSVSESQSGNLAPNTTSWVQTGLMPNTTYNIYVEAFTFWGSTPTQPAMNRTGAAMPLNVSITARTSDTITLDWDENSNPYGTHYAIYRSTDDFTVSSSCIINYANFLLNSSFKNEYLSVGATYYYRVTAYNENIIESVYETTVSTPTKDDVQPGPALSLNSWPGMKEGEVSITWTTPGNNGYTDPFRYGSEYRIQYSTWEGVSWDPYAGAQVAVSTSGIWPYGMAGHTAAGLTGGNTYFFRLWYVDEWLNCSPISAQTSSWAQVDMMPPAMITNLTSSQGSWIGSVNLSWSSPGDNGWLNSLNAGSGYGVFYSTNPYQNFNNPTVVISTAGVNPNDPQSSIIGALDPGTTYYFWMATSDEAGNKSALSQATTAWATMPPVGTDNLVTYNSGADGWRILYDNGVNTEYFMGLAFDPSGNIFVAGEERHVNSEVLVRKYNSAGAHLWTRVFNGPTNSADGAYGVAADNSGNVIVAGTIDDTGTTFDMMIRKYDGNGNTVWTDYVKNFGFDIGRGVATDAADNVYVTGYVPSGGGDVWVRKYNSGGAILWTSTFTSAGNQNDKGMAVCAKPTGIYVTGSVFNAITGSDLFVARFNPGTGLLEMSTSYSWSQASGEDSGYGITADDSGNIYVAGSMYDTNLVKHVALIAKFSSTGVILASTTYAADADESRAYGVALDPNYGLYFTGYEMRPSDNKIWVMKINDANGLIQWTTTYQNASAPNYDRRGYGLAVAGSSVVYVAGYDNYGAGADGWLRKYVQTMPNGVPTGFWASSRTATSIRWEWFDGITNEDGYRVKYSSGGYKDLSESQSGNLAANTTNWIQTGLKPNTTYNMYVEAFTFWGSTPSMSSMGRTHAAIPINVTVSARTTDSVTLDWNDNSNPFGTRYGVSRTTDNFIASSATVANYWDNLVMPSFVSINLMTGVTYYHRVIAFNDEGLETTYETTVTTPTKDDIQPGSAYSLSSWPGMKEGEVAITWTTPGNNGYSDPFRYGSEYRIQYSTWEGVSWNPYTGAQIVVSTTGVGPYWMAGHTATGLTGGSTYFFHVWYVDEWLNCSPISAGTTAWAQLDMMPPATITNLASSQGAWIGSVDLSWASPGDNGWLNSLNAGSGYGIFYSTNPYEVYSLPMIEISTSGVNPNDPQMYRVAGLDPGVTYYFKMETWDETLNIGALSQAVTAWATLPSPGTDQLTQYIGMDNWLAKYITSGDDTSRKIAADSYGNIYSIGGTFNGSNNDILLRKYTANGQVVWTKYYNGATNANEAGSGIAIDTSNNIYVVGFTSAGASAYDIWVRKYDQNGNIVWTDTYNSPAGNRNDIGQGIDVDDLGNIYVVGTNDRGDIGQLRDTWVRKYNPNGFVLWTSTFNNGNEDESFLIKVTKDINRYVYVAGYSYYAGSGDDMWLAQLNNNNGLTQWTTTYNRSSYSDRGEALTTFGSGAVVGGVAQSGVAGSTGDIFIREYDSSGNLLWSTIYDGPSGLRDSVHDFATDNFGNLYAVGYITDASQQLNIWVRKYNYSGLAEWTTTYNSATNGNDEGYGILVISTNVYVGAHEEVAGQMANLWLRKLGQEHPNLAPSGLYTSNIWTNTIRWNWNDNSTNETGYRVKLSSVVYDPVSGSYSGDLPPNTTYYVMNGLQPNTSYTVYAEAYTFWGTSTTASLGAWTEANAPVNLRVISRSSNTISLQWDANSNPDYTRYVVWYSTDNFSADTRVLVQYDPGFTGYTTTQFNLELETTYYYRAGAYNMLGSLSNYSNYVSTITPDTVPPPSPSLSAAPGTGEGQISLMWSAGGDNGYGSPLTPGSQYRIQYATYSTPVWDYNTAQVVISTYGIPGAQPVYHTIKNLLYGTTYYLKLWIADEVPNWSELGQTATTYASEGIYEHVWNGAGGDNLASNESNWVGGSGPSANDGVLFSAVNPSKYCIWDLPIDISTVTMTSDYVSSVTISVPFTVTNELRVEGGKFDIAVSSIGISGSMVISSNQFEARTSTIVFNGTQNQWISLFTPTTFYSMQFERSNSVYLPTIKQLLVNGNINILNGTFDIINSTVVLKGNLTRTSGQIASSGGRWILSGSGNQLFAPINGYVYNIDIDKVDQSTATINLTNVYGDINVKNGVYSWGAYGLYHNGDLNVYSPSQFICTGSTYRPSGSKHSIINVPEYVNFACPVYIDKDVGYSVSLASPSLKISGSLDVAVGTLYAGNKNLTVSGIVLTGSSSLDTSGSTVTVTGNNYGLSGGTFSFRILNIDNPGAGIGFSIANKVDVAEKVVVTPNSYLKLPAGFGGEIYCGGSVDINGKFELAQGTIGVLGDIRINNGGIVDMTGANQSIVAASGNIKFGHGSKLIADSINNDIICSTAPGSYFAFEMVGTSIQINGLGIHGLDSNGIVISSDSYILSFSSIDFGGSIPGGKVIDFRHVGTGQYTFDNCYFETNASTNIYVSSITYPGHVLMTNASGPKAGYNYEYDPNNVVFWNAAIPPAVFTGAALSTTSIQWNWNDVPDALFYRVRNSTGGMISANLAENVTYWMESGLTPNTSCQRYVDVYNPIQVSTMSPMIVKYSAANPPLNMQIVTRSSYSITLDWDPNNNPDPGTLYSVLHSTSNDMIPNFVTPATVSNVVVTGLDPFTSYYIQAYAYNGDYEATSWTTMISTTTHPPYVAPVSTMTYPVNGGAYNALASIAGTAYVIAPATVAAVYVEIYNVNNGLYFDGAGFNNGTPAWLLATGKENWTYAMPALTTNKIYRIRTYAKDDYNRDETQISEWFIYYDTGTPITTIISPIDNSVNATLSMITGTSVDFETGIKQSEVRLCRSADNNYYDGSSWVVNPSTWLITNGAANWNYSLPALTSGYYMANSRAVDFAGNYQTLWSTANFYMLGHAERLVLVAPGQSFAPGSAPGKIGTPVTQTAGQSFMVTAYAVDSKYFVDTTTNSKVTITTPDDPADTEPSPADLTMGTMTFTVTLVRATTASWVTATSQDLTSDTTGFTVNAAPPDRLQLLLPGETAVGGKIDVTPYGKTGTPTARKAGEQYIVTVNLTDAYWNKSTADAPQVAVYINGDSYSVIQGTSAIASGTRTFTVTAVVANASAIMYADDVDGTGAFYAQSASANFAVNAATGTRLLVILPGETFTPGKLPYTVSSAGGKSGTPSNRPILNTFYVTVRATDDWWNIQTASNPTVTILTSDPLDSDGGSAPLIAGENTFPVTFASEGNWYVNATDINYGLATSSGTQVTAVDSTPPCAISDLTGLKGTAHGTARLMWTAPGDNGAADNITGGQIWIRYTDGGQIADFNAPPGSWGERLIASTDTTAGSPQTIIVTGLTAWTTYYFAVRVSDGGQFGSWSTSGVNTLNYSLAQDTAAPVFTNLQAGDYTWRSADPGAVYNVDFEDINSSLGSIEYSANTGQNMSGAQLIGWTQISAVTAQTYNANWGVNFALLVEGATNYISVRANDLAGNYATFYDVFKVFKDTTAPQAPLLASPADGAVDVTANLSWSASSEESFGSKLADANRYYVEITLNPDGSGMLDSAYTMALSATLSASDGVRYWRVRSYDNAGNFSAWSSTRSITITGTAPSQPTGFMGTAISSTVIHWEWTDNATNETAYRVRFTTSVSGYANLAANTTYYDQIGLTPNFGADRYVVAFNAVDESIPSNTQLVYTLANDPLNLALTGVAYSSASVTWDINNNPANTRFEIQWTTDGSFAVVDATSSLVTGNFYTINGLSADTSYYVRVRAVNLDTKYTGYSNFVSTLTPVGPPAAPTGFDGVSLSTFSVLWAWTDNTATETGYRIYNSTGGLLYQVGVNVTYYIETTLSPNETAARYVRSYNGSGESASSSLVTKYTVPLPPVNIASSAQTPSTITLTWTPGSGGAARYYIERSIDNVTFEPIANWGTNVTAASHQDLGLLANTSYYYRIGAYNNDQQLSALSAVFAQKTQYMPPEIISGKVTQSDGTPITGVELKASKSGSSITYTVYTTTGGDYTIELERAIAAGTYKIEASWTANDVVSSVYIDNIANGTGGVNFTLEVKYELATISGQIAIARSLKVMKALGAGEPAGYVELIQNSKVICKLAVGSDGKYKIPNLLPGKYGIRAYNGVAYSNVSIVDLKEGDNVTITFKYDLLNPDMLYMYPNPVVNTGHAALHFESSGDDIEARINIYTISGELVKSASQDDCVVVQNVYEYNWDLTNNDGDKVASGVYIYNVKVRSKLTGETASITKKCAVVR